MAPEIIDRSKRALTIGKDDMMAADIWSLGTTF